MNMVLRFESLLRRAYIDVRNRRLIARYVLSPMYLLYGFLRTIHGGIWNAVQLQRGRPAPGTEPVLFHAEPGEKSRVAFMLRLAQIPFNAVPSKGGIDVVLNLAPDAQPGPFASIARHVPLPLDLHFAWSATDARRIMATLAPLGNTEPPSVAAALQSTMMRRLRPRQIYANTAREYLKSVDWASRFCAISASGADVPTLVNAIDDTIALSQGWRFLWLGDDLPKSLQYAHASLAVPAHAGVDLSLQLALAAEADAYFGDWNVFGVAAALAGRPVTIRRPDHVTIEPIPSIRELQGLDHTSIRNELVRLMRQPDFTA